VHVRRLLAKRYDDRGAVATVFGILLSGGVLLGLMALVVDVGQIYVERGELQTGADAAALGVAKACATDTPDCSSYAAAFALAQRYADANSSDGLSHVDFVCGVLTGILSPCPVENTNLTACLGAAPTTGNYVEVRLSTEVPGHKLALPPSFAQAVLPDFDGASVGACARVAWREPVNVRILKIGMSTCAFDDATFVAPPPYPPYPAPGEQEWLGTGGPCRGDGATVRAAAVFTVAGSNCEFEMPANGVIPGRYLRNGRFPVGRECETRLASAMSASEVVYMPVYAPTGPEGTFTVAFLAAVVVTGLEVGTDPGQTGDNGHRGAIPSDCVDTEHSDDDQDDDTKNHRCISVVVVGQLDLAALVGGAAVDLIG
jgi:Flp pilus assembly protein TadG